MATKITPTESSAIKQLVDFYLRNGYIRVPDKERRKKDSRNYKMGYEIRLVARTKQELALIRRLLRIVGLKTAKSFTKKDQWCQPIYGKQAAEQFTEWIDDLE